MQNVEGGCINSSQQCEIAAISKINSRIKPFCLMKMFVFFDKLFLLIIDNIYIYCAMTEKEFIIVKIYVLVLLIIIVFICNKNLLINLDKWLSFIHICRNIISIKLYRRNYCIHLIPHRIDTFKTNFTIKIAKYFFVKILFL